jgi:hypothetical protein
MMQPSCPGLSLVMRAGFTVMSQRMQQFSRWKMKSKVKSMTIIFFDIKGGAHKKFILAGQTVNPAHSCDVLW